MDWGGSFDFGKISSYVASAAESLINETETTTDTSNLFVILPFL